MELDHKYLERVRMSYCEDISSWHAQMLAAPLHTSARSLAETLWHQASSRSIAELQAAFAAAELRISRVAMLVADAESAKVRATQAQLQTPGAVVGPLSGTCGSSAGRCWL